MPTRQLILATHAFWCPEGTPYTIPSAGTTGAESKPGPTDAGHLHLGKITKYSPETKADRKPFMEPSPGRLMTVDEEIIALDFRMKFTFEKIGRQAMEFIYHTLALTSDTAQFNPLEGGTKKGWLKVQQYDNRDTLRYTADFWVSAMIDGAPDFKDGKDYATWGLDCLLLRSSLNTGVINLV